MWLETYDGRQHYRCFYYLGEDWDVSKSDSFRCLYDSEKKAGLQINYAYYSNWNNEVDEKSNPIITLLGGPEADKYERKLVPEDQKHKLWELFGSGEYDGYDVPKFLDCKRLEKYCISFLQKKVLDYVTAQPIPESYIDTLNKPEQVTPFTISLPSLFGVITPEQRELLDAGKPIYHNKRGKFSGGSFRKVDLFHDHYVNPPFYCGVAEVNDLSDLSKFMLPNL